MFRQAGLQLIVMVVALTATPWMASVVAQETKVLDTVHGKKTDLRPQAEAERVTLDSSLATKHIMDSNVRITSGVDRSHRRVAGIRITEYRAWAKATWHNPFNGANVGNGVVVLNEFQTTCGAKLVRSNGDNFVLYYDNNGPQAPFRHVGNAKFEFAGNGRAPYDIDQLVIEGGFINKHYQGQANLTRHSGWDGHWAR